MLSTAQRQELFQKYQTNLNGLSRTQAAERLKKDGLNRLVGKSKKSLLVTFVEEFKDLMVIILIIAAVLAIIGGEVSDAAVILFIVFLNACIGFIQKYKAEKAIEALKKMVAPKARVLRDGTQTEIGAEEIVVGDILILSEGDSIGADALLFEVNEMETQESTLTGESLPVQKLDYDILETQSGPSEKENIVYMGTNVTHGSGKAIVIHTGMGTEMGKIAKLTTETKKDLSPLQKDLLHIGSLVGKIVLVISGGLFTVGLIQGKSFIETLLFATSVAVAAVPEGLPATVTIALAIGVQRLAKKNAIVKQLSSVETLGSTTVICSDKTGTLTKNEMTVKEIHCSAGSATVSGVGYQPIGKIQSKTLSKEQASFEFLINIAVLCNNAELVKEEEKNSAPKQKRSMNKDADSFQSTWKILGDPTEGALLTLAEKSPHSVQNIKNRFEKIAELPFDSKRKLMTVIVKNTETKEYFAFTKGAPDSIIEISSQQMGETDIHSFGSEKKKSAQQQNEKMAKKALRGLGFAYRKLETKNVEHWQKAKKFPHEHIEKELIFVGLVGMIDPPRDEVKAAVEMAHKAGIRTYIITGDHGLTAEAIAKDLAIISEKRKHQVISGHELDTMPETELKKLLNNKKLDIIFARVSPEHKLRIVSALEELQEIVAVTGDGVNDAPALKKADIGIAMGITGTDVSKEAANMVLADDSYSTIVTAIQEGRTIYINLKKFIFYIFSCNIAELMTVFASVIFNLPPALTAILILCINLGTDVLPAVALGVEPAEPGIMDQKPHTPGEKIMNKAFITRYSYLGFVMGIVVMGVYIWTLYNHDWVWGAPLDNFSYLKASTTAFALLVVIQMVNVFNARSETLSIFKMNFFSNPYLLGAVLISLVMVIAIIEVPLLQKILHTTSLSVNEWSIIMGASFIPLAAEEIRKFVFAKQK